MLTSLVSLLPASAQPYAKTITAALLSVLTVLSTTLPDAPSWLGVVIALLSAPAVFAVPNLDPAAEKQDESVQPPTTPADTVQSLVTEALNQPLPGSDDDEPKPTGGYWGGV